MPDVTPLKKFIGRGDIYVGVTPPAANTALALTSGVPSTGTNVGLTTAEAVLTYKPTFTTMHVEQAVAEVVPRLTAETVELKFQCGEATWQNIALALQTGTSRSATSPARSFLTVGGQIFFNTQGVVLVSPFTDPTDPTGTWYEWVCLYNALSVSGLAHTYKNTQTRTIDVMFTGYADVTRPIGDQLFQIGQQTAAS